MANEYVTAATLKATLSITEATWDADVTAACAAASKVVEQYCDRRFWKDTSAADRYYTPADPRVVTIDDLADYTASGLTTDQDGDGTYETTWTENTDFAFEPLNAETDGWPRTRIVIHPRSSLYWAQYPRSVKLNGKWGWDAVPAEVTEATTIVAARLFRRAREAPFGVIGMGLDGAAVRISRFDPDVALLLDPFRRLLV